MPSTLFLALEAEESLGISTTQLALPYWSYRCIGASEPQSAGLFPSPAPSCSLHRDCHPLCPGSALPRSVGAGSAGTVCFLRLISIANEAELLLAVPLGIIPFSDLILKSTLLILIYEGIGIYSPRETVADLWGCENRLLGFSPVSDSAV